MTMAEVGAAMESLGCVQAVNLDGGGSSILPPSVKVSRKTMMQRA